MIQLCEKMNSEARQIVSFVNKDSTFCSDIFALPVIMEKWSDKAKTLRGRYGIYVFLVENAISLSYEQVFSWNEALAGAKFKEYKNLQINEGDCLYVGSCVSKSLYSRVKEHFSDGGSFQALKLEHPNRKNLFDVICIAFPIKCDYSEHHRRILLPALEKRLHELLLPLCGSNRV